MTKLISTRKNRWGTGLLIIFLTVIAALLGYNYFLQRMRPQPIVEAVPSPTPTPTLTAKPNKVLSDREKITQLLAIPVDVTQFLSEEKAASATEASFTPQKLVATSSSSTAEWIQANKPGVIVYFGKNIASASAQLATSQIRQLYPPTAYAPLFAVDHEGGSVQRLNGQGFSQLDNWQALVMNYTPTQQEIALQQSAQQLATVGINMVFSPVVDLASQSAVLGNRAAADPALVKAAAEKYISIFGRFHIMPVLKHYPGIGSLTRDIHTQSATITLQADDTKIFSQLLDESPNIGVMTTHVSLTDRFNGTVCSLSADCLSPLIKNYPQVLVVTDDLNMTSARMGMGTTRAQTLSETAIAALKAGNNLLVFGPQVTTSDLDAVVANLVQLYTDSLSFRNQVDQSLAKILQLKQE